MKNILLITSDEMRGDSPGCTGNPDVKTPHIDALAARGTVCEKHFVVFPKCVPSRCSMHTGRYTHTDGFRTVMGDNHLPKGSPNLGEFLGNHGYETAVLGLNHVWEEEWFYGKGELKNQKGAGVMDYNSFTEGPLGDMAKQSSKLPEGTPRTGDHFKELEEVDFEGLKTGELGGFSDVSRAAQACRYLEELRDPAKPFFLQVNFSKPHPPYDAPEPYYSMYNPAEITPFPYDLPVNASLPLRAQRKWRLGDNISEAALREMQAVYYSMVSFVDAQIGKVLDCLKAQGLEEDTLVIFCSDHGDYAGQYGINEKWDASLQDCLLHVPFVIAGEGIAEGARFTGLSEHVDLPATIMEYLGFERPEDWVWHGESMLPHLASGKGKPAVFADGGHEEAMRSRFDRPVWGERNGRKIKETGGKQLCYQQCPDSMARCKMVRTEEWKLVIRETGGNELFHMTEDPYEMKNLYGEPQYASVVSELQLQLIEWTLRTDTDRPYLKVFGA